MTGRKKRRRRIRMIKSWRERRGKKGTERNKQLDEVSKDNN